MGDDTHAEDRQLVARVANGDTDALSQLYERFAPTLLGLGTRVLGSRRDAEDLLHDVFVEVWRKAGTYNPKRGTVRSWLLIRMRSRALDRLRAPARSRAVAINEEKLARRPAPVVDDPHLAPDRTTARESLQVLPEAQRTVLELAYFGGFSSSEIAAKMGIPIGTVKSRARAALASLRSHLGVARTSEAQ